MIYFEYYCSLLDGLKINQMRGLEDAFDING